MKAFACLVRQTPNAWSISIGEARPKVLNSAGLVPSELAREVFDYLDQSKATHGRCHNNIVLCPQPSEVLFATSPIPSALKARDRQQLKYHAESLLPIDAERMAADFVVTAKDLRVMAIDNQEWQPIIDAFAARDLHFRAIAPAGVLAIEEAKRTVGGSSSVIVWEDDGACDLWRLDSSGIERWTHLADSSNDRLLALRLFAAQTSDVQNWTAINCQPQTLSDLNQINSIELQSMELESQWTYAARAADRLSQSTFEAWFDLRDGSIAGDDRYRNLYGWMRASAITAASFLLILAGACLWKSFQTERQIAAIQAAHEELFDAVFPGKEVPALISKVIESEQKKLLGTTNESGENKIAPSALEVLHATLVVLQSDGSIPVQATRLDIQNGMLDADILFENRQDASLVSDQFKLVGVDRGAMGGNLERGKIRSNFKGMLRITPNTKAGASPSDPPNDPTSMTLQKAPLSTSFVAVSVDRSRTRE